MNFKKYIHSLLAVAMTLAGASALSSCSEDLEYPPLGYPTSDLEANMTILELKEKYWQASTDNYCTLVEQNEEGEDIVIRGRVIGNDITGNIYQQLIIQDETAAVTISVTKSDIYKGYPLGEEVFVNMTGLYVGKYANLFQIGAAGTRTDGSPTTNRMDEKTFDAHVERNGVPEPEKINTLQFSIAEIQSMKGNVSDQQKYQSQLVEIKDVSFVGGGSETWATQGSSGDNRYIQSASGQQLLVRNSGKSSFCTEKMPAGTGTVVGVLQWFSNDWQFVFRTNEDCFGFSDAPIGPQEPVDGLNETFTGGIPTSWTNVATSGNAKWFARDYSGNGSAEVTGYNKAPGASGFESWLISPAVDLDKVSKKQLSFDAMVGYSGAGTIEAYILTDVDPAKGTATKLEANNIPQASGQWSDWKSNSVDLSSYSGVVYIGFVYRAETSSGYTTYRVDNVVVGEGGSTPVEPVEPGTPEGDVKFRVATSITSGNQYVLVVDGQVGTAISASESFGRLGMKAVEIVDGEFTTDAANAITITAVDGGYTLVDSFGRYLSMDGSHLTSFQIYSAQEAGSVWSITVDAQGVATIANNLNTDCNVVRSGTFTNIAPSDIVKYTEFDRPTLYELVK
ncbi:MAG: choice-of-anchor J domain-containing protein [Paramuribaculum sp.]|nr:choice-of-anchor J domain-containing protein [Paramuribaculum sp.]